MPIPLLIAAVLLGPCAWPVMPLGPGAGNGSVFVKQKDGERAVKDKSKPVRRELEALFAERVRATIDGDGEALVAMVHPDYAFVMPDGTQVGSEWLKAYMRRGVEQFVEVKDFTLTIETIYPQQEGETLVAVVEARQRFTRTQRLADGQIHEVFSTVLQDETWVRVAPAIPATAATPAVPARWQLRGTANLREQTITVDGQPREQFGR
jgi:hypothetical protein